jgi:hypothetical protein
MIRIAIILCVGSLVVFTGCGGSFTAQQQPPPTQPPTQPTPFGGVSISAIVPGNVAVGSADLMLTIAGTNLDIRHSGTHQTSTVAVWSANGTDTVLSAIVISSTQLTAVAPAALLAKPVTASLAVQKWYFADDSPFAVSNSLTFEVTATASPTVVPAAEILGPSGTRQFSAAGFEKDSRVGWSIEEGAVGGTITADGVYTAPSHNGAFHVVATSTSVPSTTATASVTVTSSGFVPAGSMHVARSRHSATLLKSGKVLILGGDDSAELFDPVSGSFSVIGPPVTGRLNATATLLADGRVLIAGGLGLTGGSDGFLPILNSAEIFDPATGTFSATGSMIQGRQKHTATLLGDGRVLVAGGYFDHICTTASAELFDPATGMFTSTGFMLTERVFHTATLLQSGEVLMAGGSNGCAPDAADDPPWDPLFVELYKPRSGHFAFGGDMSTTRDRPAAILRSDGKVLMLGGIPSLQNLHEQPANPSYAEIYNPAAQAFSAIAGLTILRTGYTVTLLNDGMVLIAGGEDATGSATTAAQLLDPVSGILSETGAMGYSRVGHTATLLQDGRVLITGGADAKGNALASAELYK